MCYSTKKLILDKMVTFVNVIAFTATIVVCYSRFEVSPVISDVLLSNFSSGIHLHNNESSNAAPSISQNETYSMGYSHPKHLTISISQVPIKSPCENEYCYIYKSSDDVKTTNSKRKLAQHKRCSNWNDDSSNENVSREDLCADKDRTKLYKKKTIRNQLTKDDAEPRDEMRVLMLHPIYAGSHEMTLRTLGEELAKLGHFVTQLRLKSSIMLPVNRSFSKINSRNYHGNSVGNMEVITISPDNSDMR